MSGEHWLILLTVVLIFVTVPLTYYAWRGFHLQRLESATRDRPELVELMPPTIDAREGSTSGVIFKATFKVKNVGRGHATNVSLFIVVRNDDGTYGMQEDKPFQVTMCQPGDVLTIEAIVSGLKQTRAVNLMVAGSYLDHTGNLKRVYRVPSDEWLRSWMPKEAKKRRRSQHKVLRWIRGNLRHTWREIRTRL